MNLTKGLYNHDSAMGTNIHIIYGRHDFFDTLNDFGIVDFFYSRRVEFGVTIFLGPLGCRLYGIISLALAYLVAA